MTPRNTDMTLVYLKPGEMHLTAEPTLVTTVLGSCVSVTMYNPRLGIGAICHIMLPKCKCKENCSDDCMQCLRDAGNGCHRECDDSFRYADCSIPSMLKTFKECVVGPEELEVKMFGGSDMLSSRGRGGSIINVGKQNIEAALQGIEGEGLKLSTYDVGGSSGRKILFYTHTGEVFLKRL